jgi:hypothetical protein
MTVTSLSWSPSRGGPAALVIRWAEATIYGPDEDGRLERRSSAPPASTSNGSGPDTF